MSVLLARHGETDWNTAKRIQGTTDIPLNDNGLKQAQLLYQSLAGEKVNVSRIYCSRQKRALKTAETVSAYYKVPVQVIHGLEEMNFGIFEGHTWEEIAALYPDELDQWQSDKRYHRVPDGESCQDLLERLFLAFEQIAGEAEAATSAGDDILIITHGMVILSLLTLQDDLDFGTSYKMINIENARAIKFEWNKIWEIRQKLQVE
jgi:probable phosphoglycerate mutase